VLNILDNIEVLWHSFLANRAHLALCFLTAIGGNLKRYNDWAEFSHIRCKNQEAQIALRSNNRAFRRHTKIYVQKVLNDPDVDEPQLRGLPRGDDPMTGYFGPLRRLKNSMVGLPWEVVDRKLTSLFGADHYYRNGIILDFEKHLRSAYRHYYVDENGNFARYFPAKVRRAKPTKNPPRKPQKIGRRNLRQVNH
jgi:hypothetical protein